VTPAPVLFPPRTKILIAIAQGVIPLAAVPVTIVKHLQDALVDGDVEGDD